MLDFYRRYFSPDPPRISRRENKIVLTWYGKNDKKRYERDPLNRRIALEIHGTVCVVCGFDFEKFYGKRGQGFIEVHHTLPLSLSGEQQPVNPQTDLLPVCSNCHRIIHRRRDKVLTIEEMKQITKTQSNLQDSSDE